MARILLAYDIKMANGNAQPDNVWYGTSCVPDEKVEVLFRKRKEMTPVM